MEKIAVYPGTFDPITNGHKSIAERASALFTTLIIAVASSPDKHNIFSTEERVLMAQETFSALPNVHVESFSGLLVDYVKSKNSMVIIRGLRALADFEYEFQLALANRDLSPSIETLFFMTDHKYLFISSSLVKSIAKYGGNISTYVPPNVAIQLGIYYNSLEK